MADTPYFKSDDPADPPPPAAQKTSWLLYALIGVAALALVVVMMRGKQQRDSGADHPAVGKTVERLHLEPLTGDAAPVALSDLQGKVTLVNFWGTWCPPCQAEFPHIVALGKEFSSEETFQLLAVSCEPDIEKDIDRLRDTTAQFLEKAKASLPTYYDPQGITRSAVYTTAGQFAFPATVIFDRQGKIAAYWVGYYPGTEKEMANIVRSLLEKP